MGCEGSVGIPGMFSGTNVVVSISLDPSSVVSVADVGNL